MSVTVVGASNTSQPTETNIEVDEVIALPGTVPRSGSTSNTEEENEGEQGGEGNNEEGGTEGDSSSREENNEEDGGESNPPQNKIKFADQEFDSPEEALKYAERLFKTTRNGQSSAAKLVNALQKQVGELTERLNALSNGNRPSQNNEGEGVEIDAEEQQFWKDYHQHRLMVEHIKDPQERLRQQIILEATLSTHLLQKVKDEIFSELRPLKEERTTAELQNKIVNEAENAFTTVAQDKNDDGTVAFPELEQEEDLTAIVKMWESYRLAGMPLKLLNSADHIRLMILAYRQDKTGSVKTPPSPAPKKKTVVSSPFPKPNLTKVNVGGIPGQSIPGVFPRTVPSRT